MTSSATLFLCGDVMLGRGIDQILPHPNSPRLQESHAHSALDYLHLAEAVSGPIARPVELDYVWGDALDELARVRPDLRIINLETAITTSDDFAQKGINYRMHPFNIGCLTAARIDCCVLANNHTLDWGVSGLTDTLDTLNQATLPYAGAGRNAAEAAAPAIMSLPYRGRLLVFAFGMPSAGVPRSWAAGANSPGLNVLTDLSERSVERIAANIAAVRQAGDIVVVSLHWGGNWGYAIAPEMRQFAHQLIDIVGVDLIHGHSSHHVKGLEVYRDKLILYGCGDFLNDYEGISGHEEYRSDLALAYFPTLEFPSGRLLHLRMSPMQIRKFQLQRASRTDAEWLRDCLNREGTALGTRVALRTDGMLYLRTIAP